MSANNVEFGIRITADGKIAVAEAAKVKAAYSDIAKSTGQLSGATGQAASQGTALASALARVGHYGTAAFAVREAVAFAGAMIDARVAADKLNSSLAFAVGRDNVSRELAYVSKTAYTLGLDINSAATAYAKLNAAAQGTAISSAQVKQIFESVSKASTVMGLSSEETNGALLALSQMMSKGTVQAEELRGQLGERIPGAFGIAARAMGVTQAELNKMLDTGSVMASDFLPKFAAELLRTLGDAPNSAAKSAQAELNRLSTAWESFKRSLADSGAVSAGVGVLGGLAVALKDATQALEEARNRGWGTTGQGAAVVGGFLYGYDTPDEQRRAAVAAVKRNERAQWEMQQKAKANDGYLSPFDQEEVRNLQREGARLREELNGLLSAGQRIEVNLKADFDAAQAAQKSRYDAYIKDGSRKTQAQQFDESMKSERAKFRDAVVGLDEHSKEYQAALAGFETAKIGLQKKFGKDAQALLSADFDARVALAKKQSEVELAQLENAHAHGEVSERDYLERMKAIREAAITAEIKILGEQYGKTTDPVKRKEIVGKIQALTADWVKAEEDGMARIAAANQKAADAASKAWLDYFGPLEEALAKAQEEADVYGLTEAEIQRLKEARLADGLAVLQRRQAQLQAEDANQGELDAIQSAIDAYEHEIEIRQKLADAADIKRSRDQQVDLWKSIDSAAHQAFLSIGNSGKSTFDRLRDTLKSGLYDLLYQMTVKPWLIQLSASVSGSSVGGAVNTALGGSSGGMGMGFGGGSYNPLGGSLSAGDTGFAGLWSSAPVNTWTNLGFSSFGETLGLSQTVGEGVKQLTSAGEFLSANGAQMLGYAGALYSLSQGNYGSAAGAAIGTMIMPGVGTTIGSMLGGMLDGGGEDPHDNADSTGFAFKLAKGGVSGTGTGAGITDEVPANLPYSWVAGQTSGRGRWNDGTALTAAQIAQIAQASAAVFASGKNMASILGVDASVVDTASVSSTGFKSVEDALGQLGDEIALKLVPNLKQFQISGQSLWQTLQTNVSAVAALKAQFQSFRDGLNMSDLSTLDPLGKYRLAKDLYNKALAAGDAAAVTSTAQSFLSASRTAFGSTGAYATDYQGVLDTLTQLENTVVQYPWAKGASGTSSTAPQLSTPANDAVVNNTQATVNVLQSGLSDIIAALQAQGETLTEIQRKLGLQLAAA